MNVLDQWNSLIFAGMYRCAKYPILVLLVLLSATFGCKKDDEEPEEEKVTEFNTNEFCEDSCFFSMDGECDDGGIGSSSDYCNFGTDCSDCGTRVVKTPKR